MQCNARFPWLMLNYTTLTNPWCLVITNMEEILLSRHLFQTVPSLNFPLFSDLIIITNRCPSIIYVSVLVHVECEGI